MKFLENKCAKENFEMKEEAKKIIENGCEEVM